MPKYFNSIKVRLKRIGNTTIALSINIFQFHKGTIETKYRMFCQCTSYYFNSIKVRLKQERFVKVYQIKIISIP